MNENSHKIKRHGFINWEHISASITRKALGTYLGKIEDFLQKEEDRFQKNHSDLQAEIKKISPEKRFLYSSFYLEQSHQYRVEFPRILHNSFILIAISLLESELAIMCKRLQEEHQIPISWKELKGSTLDQVKNYCKLSGLNLTRNDENWQEIRNLYMIRNCIVHNNGAIENSGDERILKAYAKKNSIISQDNRELDVTKQYCSNVINVTRDFTDKLWDIVLRTRPKIIRGV